jgi:acetylornithine aminotransferase
MSKLIIDQADQVMAATYQRFPIVITRGQGCELFDDQDRRYLDFVAGIAVCCLGHAHPKITEALTAQAAKLWHVSNLYYTVPQTKLAQWLVSHSFADRAFFCNSGAEANEAAIKLARKYFYDQGRPERFRIISMAQSFHGRTMGALSATGQDKIRKGFDPVLDGFDFVPFNDIKALEAKISPATCAVLLEPLQGEGGVRCPDEDYLKAVRQVCDQAGLLLIFDEIQTGMGRTGKLFAHEHFDMTPDIMTLAKALGNGLPIGAMLAKEEVAQAFDAGAHATTFGGTPLVTAAALAVVQTLETEKIVDQCAAVGTYFKAGLRDLQARHECIEVVRGKGLLLGLQLNQPGGAFVTQCLKKGFLINCIQERILRFVPPLIVTKGQVDRLVACLDEILP